MHYSAVDFYSGCTDSTPPPWFCSNFILLYLIPWLYKERKRDHHGSLSFFDRILAVVFVFYYADRHEVRGCSVLFLILEVDRVLWIKSDLTFMTI